MSASFPWMPGGCNCGCAQPVVHIYCGSCVAAGLGAECGFPTVDIEVRDSSDNLVAEFTQTVSGAFGEVLWTPGSFDTYTITFTPRDGTWFGPATATVTVSASTDVLFATPNLPFLQDGDYTCIWCGDAFMPRQLWLTDGAGMLSFTWGPGEWEATRLCVPTQGTTTQYSFTYRLKPTGCGTDFTFRVDNQESTGALQVGTIYADYGTISLGPCTAPAGGPYFPVSTDIAIYSECSGIFNGVTISV